jgi:hypothetical protein
MHAFERNMIVNLKTPKETKGHHLAALTDRVE